MICGKRGSVYRAQEGFALVFIVFLLALIFFLRPATGETQTLVKQELKTAFELDNPVSLEVFASQVSIDTATIRTRFQHRPGAPKLWDFSQVVFCSIHQVYEAKVNFNLAQQPRSAFYDPLGQSTQSSDHGGTATDLGTGRKSLEIDTLVSGNGSFDTGNSCPMCSPELKVNPN